MKTAKNFRGLEKASLEIIQDQLERGSFTSEILVKTYIQRIEQVDPIVHSIAQLNPDAVMEAAERDRERQAGKTRGALHGIPILLKDTFATLDSMDTTGGSFALIGARPLLESTVVKELRAAGAIILGKTTMSEFGYSRTPDAPNGWSPLHGQCLGAFCADQDPRGSSSGCGVAMSLGLAAATIGGETFGSITYPADRNGVVGLKPTVGLTSRAGVIPIYKYQDTVGPIVQSVRDAAIILQIIAGKDPLDDATNDIPFREIPDYLAACRSDGFKESRVAVPRSCISPDEDPEVISSFNRALEIMSSLGGTVIDNTEFPEWKARNRQRNELYDAILLREGLEGYFCTLDKNPHNIYTVADLITFMQTNPDEQCDTHGTEWLEDARDAEYTTSAKEFHLMRDEAFDEGEEIQQLLDKYDCDALVVPTFTDVPHDMIGNPTISVPLGFYSSNVNVERGRGLVSKAPNIPYGLIFVGRRFSEVKLLGLAFAFEQATNIAKQRQPYIYPTADLLSGTKTE